jgi:sigma-B regulation protein RsbU (phosphoserine phosphatase)
MHCPQQVTEGLNKHFSNESYVNHSFTLVYGVMDLESRVFDYTSAGHIGPIKVAGDGKVEQFESHGPPVGMLEDAVYGRSRITFEKGESLFLLSDGVYEARNPAGVEMGLKGVYDHLESHGKGRSPLEFTVNGLALKSHAWSLPEKSADDISIVGFQVR